MCGISGIIDKNDAPVSEEQIRRITDLVAHRGPDAEGFHFAQGLALGHRRLAIIDLNVRGRQPMCYRDRYWITYNGEIYNYLEIRRELEQRGASFKTTSDTEVILAAYAEWGPSCLTRFNGMWAFAIFDSVERILFISRDRFGVKPLYYLEEGSRFVFGSEIKQLLALQQRVRANQHAVTESLLTYFDGHTDHTFFAGVKSLPQAHYMVYRLATHSYTLHRYYELCVVDPMGSLPLDDAISAFDNVLQDSVSLRLRSDVTVGTCLSGGLDSSTTSAIAALQYRASSGRRFTGIHAKSIEQRTDESVFARRVADHLDLDLHVVEPSTKNFIDTIDEVVYTQEEPFGSPSMFMGWHVFEEAKKRNCKVMLNGQGGDEVLLGYERYYAALLGNARRGDFLRQLWLQSRNSRLGLKEALQYYLYFTNAGVRIKRLKARSLLRKDIKDAHDFEYVRKSARSFSDVKALQRFEICTLQLPHLLRYEDRNSMRHSIETRLPFLDYRLVEAAVSLPADYKIRDGWTKYILRRVAQKLLPDDVAWRRNKLGFEAPERIWLGAHEAAMKQEIARSSILREIADHARLQRDFSQLSLKERWAYFSLAAWERVYGVSWA
jgi:asparagine synthase (glutamine-hydrolysing)